MLKAGQYDEKVPLDCVTCQTVLAKSLGPFNEWPARLQVSESLLVGYGHPVEYSIITSVSRNSFALSLVHVNVISKHRATNALPWLVVDVLEVKGYLERSFCELSLYFRGIQIIILEAA